MPKNLFALVGSIALEGVQRLNKDMSDAEKKVKEFQRELGKLGAALSKTGASLTKNLTAPMAGVAAAIGALSLKTGDYASKLLSLEESVGMSTDTLQEFENVARKAGVSSDALINTTQKLRGQLEGIKSGTGDAAEVMDQLGISVTNADGSLRSMNDLFPQVLGELNKIENTTERNVAASKLFGKNMSDLAPVLAMTADELAAVRKEAHDAGRVMSKEALVNADEFRASVAGLKAEIGVLSMQIASSFMPILQGQVIPLIQDKVVPAMMAAAQAIQGLTGWFGGLSSATQKTIIVVGTVVAATGPLLLLTGKLILAFKSMVGTVATLTGALKGLWATMIANPIGLVVTAFAALAASVVYSRQKLKELDDQFADLEAHNARTKAFQDQHKTIKTLIGDYEKLRGTDAFDPAELERLNAALDENAIAMSNNWRAFNKQAPLNELEQENRRRSIRGLKELTAAEWEAFKHSKAVTDRQRRLRKEEGEEKEELNKKAAEANERRKKDLESLVKTHKDSIDAMELSEFQLLYKEEGIALERAKSNRANEEELEVIRRDFAMRRQKIMDDEDKAEREMRAESKKRIEKEENEKLEIREEANRQWELRLLQQSDDRIKIIDAEHKRELMAAVKSGADTSAINEYYVNERIKYYREANEKIAESNAQWQDKLLRQSGDRLAILEAERLREVALAEKTGADIAAVEQYYANERARIEKNLTDKRIAYGFSVMGAIGDAFNHLGSIGSKFSSNEEKRLSREYKAKRDNINANVADETERAAQLAALDEEEEARRLEIQQRQAKRDKALGVFNTVIDTARGFMRTLAELGATPFGMAMAGGVLALGAMQTAAIVSEPEPFFRGAMIKGSPDGIVSRTGERNQDELILPMERGTRQMAADIVSELQDRGIVGGGGAGGGSAERPIIVDVKIDTVIGDDRWTKDLARKLRPVLVAEARRTGIRAV